MTRYFLIPKWYNILCEKLTGHIADPLYTYPVGKMQYDMNTKCRLCHATYYLGFIITMHQYRGKLIVEAQRRKILD